MEQEPEQTALAKAISWLAIVFVGIFVFGLVLGFPLFLLYKFIAPFFGDDPMGHLTGIGKHVAWVAGFVVVVGTIGLVLTWLSEKSKLFARFLGFLFISILVFGTLAQWSEQAGRVIDQVVVLKCLFVECH